ncbi:MAG: hypothetical protein LBF59_05110, partial [Prevotellaceae bacterium]|nr:hypothetical protein [Prevotellaceae bacterium]
QKQRFNRTLLKETIPNLTESEYESIIQKKERCYGDFLSETKLLSIFMKQSPKIVFFRFQLNFQFMFFTMSAYALASV